MSNNMFSISTFIPPVWAKGLNSIPKNKVNLGRFPTPLHKWNISLLKEYDIQWWIKRDDMTGFDLGGNKVRKLEFILADALSKGADCVITTGGIQSNHCRATAVAAKYLNLESYLVLRTNNPVDEDPGIVGNLLFSRMVESNIRTVSKEDYNEIGHDVLMESLATELRAKGKKPYIIPMGGSNSLGTWGYLGAIEELQDQLKSSSSDTSQSTSSNSCPPPSFDHIAFACGSGGTSAGIGLGNELSGLGAKVHPVGVCDSPKFFTDFIRTDMHNVLVNEETSKTLPDTSSYLDFIDGTNMGYAMTTDEEMQLVYEVSSESGVVLDPVYSGKALYAFVNHVKANPESFRGKNVLFWHTGGALGLYDKAPQINKIIKGKNNVQPLELPRANKKAKK